MSFAEPVFAQEPVTTYPVTPVKLLLGYPAGGGGDALARPFAAKLSQILGQNVVVEHKPGAGGTLAAAALAQAPADGYTLYLAESAILVAPAIYEKINYDPSALTPIGSVGNLNYAVVVNPSFPVTTTKELIDLLKVHPGKYFYGSPGVGNIGHLSAELFKKAAGVDMVHVPYKGGVQALADLIGGQIPLCFISLPAVISLAKNERLRILAVTSSKRSKAAPDVPAISETLAGFHAVSSIFLLAPPKTPAAIVDKLNAALRTVMAMPDMQSVFTAQGAGIEVSSPQELSMQIRGELMSWRTVVKAAGARAD